VTLRDDMDELEVAWRVFCAALLDEFRGLCARLRWRR
jgi:hypothetical protein